MGLGRFRMLKTQLELGSQGTHVTHRNCCFETAQNPKVTCLEAESACQGHILTFPDRITGL